MPLYSSTQNPRCLDVGQSMQLFDGTETPAVGLKSAAFARGTQGSTDAGSTFWAQGMPAGMVIDVQEANTNADADYTSNGGGQLTPSMGSPDSGNSVFTDVGRSAFYRLYVSAYTSGAMPAAGAQR